jgi:transposase
LIASEQLREDVASARATFFAEQLKDVPLADVIVLDESYVTTQFTRLRGRSLRGVRLVERVPHGHWKLLTILAAISVGGVVCAAAIDASTDADVFCAFIRESLLPALKPRQVVVMDNLPAHRVVAVRRLIESAQCRLVYLPSYSPDLSPIEPMWSKAKNVLRSIAARTVAGVIEAVGAACQAITPADCMGYYTDCGYTLHLK